MRSKQWGISLLSLVLVTLVILGSLTAFIDPFFHYHAPLPFLQYPINNQRYQNDGIVRHFDYDAIITGTSLTENFKASDCNALFGVNAVKVSFSGGPLTELDQTLRRAIEANPNIKLVLFGIELNHLVEEKGYMRYECPLYLYDNNLFNDAPYLLNKEIFCDSTIEVLNYTRSGAVTTNFDDYSFWGNMGGDLEPCKEHAMRFSPKWSPPAETEQPFTDALRQRVTENTTDILLQIAVENPDIQFYYFFPPYGIMRWYAYSRAGTVTRQVEACRLATEILLSAENIHLFSFFTDYETTTNLNIYTDDIHYSADVNASMMDRMAQGKYLLTQDNYEAHWQEVLDFYQTYDYDALYDY